MGYGLATLRVLRVFLDDPSGQAYGLELIDRTGVKAGALYPILNRLEAEGWIRGVWEEIDEAAKGRRKRRYYRLTEQGEDRARRLLSETADMLRPPVAARRAGPAGMPTAGPAWS
jgi:DNA-binding PadR family transcriptional regulator